jgi:uncharacterized BrkB/YihY/UPF0761 family membrane protein
MANKIIHYRFFFHALRTALLFIAGFLTYELLKALEKQWNKIYLHNETAHFAKRKIYHFIILLLADLFILYLFAILFSVYL